MLCGDTASAAGRERGREVTTNRRGCHCPVSPSPGEKRGSQPRTRSGSGTWGQIRSGAAAGRCGTRGQAVCGGLREALAGGQRVVEAGGEAAAGVQHRRLLGDLLEKGFPPWKEAHGEVGHKRGREKEAPLGPWRRCCQLSLKPADLNLVGLCSSTCTSCSSSRTPGPNGPFYPPPVYSHLSWLSLFLLFLLLRAIRVLELFFRAGPILMEVFSRAVVRRATLLPLCG